MAEFELKKQDAIAFLKSFKDESVDLIITDPAYESLEKHRKIGTTTRLQNWFPIFPNARFEEFFKEAYRVLKKNTHFYIFCDQETMFHIKPIGESSGFKFWKPLIWDKLQLGMGYHYRARYEFILFFEKGKRKLQDLSVPDVLDFSRIPKSYPTEKPVELLEILIRQSTLEGDIVLDPFFGSGSACEASYRIARNFIGCDINDRAISIAQERMTTIQRKQLKTFCITE